MLSEVLLLQALRVTHAQIRTILFLEAGIMFAVLALSLEREICAVRILLELIGAITLRTNQIWTDQEEPAGCHSAYRDGGTCVALKKTNEYAQ